MTAKLPTTTLIILTLLCGLYLVLAAPHVTYGIFVVLDWLPPIFFSFGTTLVYLPMVVDSVWFLVLMYAQAILAIIFGIIILRVLYRRKKEGRASERQVLYPAIAFGFFVAFALLSYVFLPLQQLNYLP